MNTIMFLNMLFLSGLTGKFSNLLSTVGTIGGALVGIALIISIVKDAMGYLKGSGSNSIGKIIGKVLLLIVMIGIIGLAANSKFDKLGQNAAEKVNELGNDTVEVIK